MQLLPPEARPFVLAQELAEEALREVRPVVVRRAAGDHRGRVLEQLLDHRRGPRGRGDDPAGLTEAEPERGHVPGLLLVAPGPELIGPDRVVLRTAKAFGLVRTEERRHRAVLPGEAALGRLVERHVPARGVLEDRPGPDLHHRVSGVARGGTDQGDRPGACRDAGPNELRARPGLSEAASCQHQPPDPIARRWELRVASPDRPVEREGLSRLGREARQERGLRRGRQALERGSQVSRRVGREHQGGPVRPR